MKVKDAAIKKAEEDFEMAEKEFDILNDKQKEAYLLAISEENKVIFITGSPGVGKSFTAKYIAEYFMNRYSKDEVIALAPSHQSKVVLRDFIRIDELEVNTIQSHCNFFPKKYSATGFEWNKIYPDYKKVCIIDEISMVSKEQFDILAASTDTIICLGDKDQLLAVGTDNVNVNEIVTIELTEQMRQEQTNKSLYKAIQRYKVAIRTKSPVDLSGIGPDDTLTLVTERKELFGSFVYDENHSKVLIAATNVMVDTYNQKVKEAVGNAKYEPDDIIIAQAPIWSLYGQEQKSDFNNGDVLKIHSVSLNTDDTVHYYNAEVSYTNQQETKNIRIPKDMDKFNEVLEIKKQDAIKNKKLWVYYFYFKNQYALVKHAYSMTTYKAQGGSFDKVYIDHKDVGKIQSWSGKDTYNRAMYVSLSRARKHATILL